MENAPQFLDQVSAFEITSGHDGRLIGDQIPQFRVRFIPHHGVQGGRPHGDPAQLSHSLGGDPDLLGEFFVGGFATQLVRKLHGDPPHLSEFIDQMDWKADGLGLVSESPPNGLLDPPRPVGAEFGAASGVEPFHALHQANVSLADQIEQRKSKAGIVMGNLDDQTEIGADHLLACRPISFLDPLP